MVSREDLEEQFSNMGATLNDDALDKCEDLCLTYCIDEEELAETWTAYSCSKGVDINPTVEALRHMERLEFGNKKKSAHDTTSSSLVVYDSQADESFESHVLSSYCATPKAKSVYPRSNGITPDHASCSSSPKVVFSPISFSPDVSTPSARYAARTNSGAVICTYGKVESARWHSSKSSSPIITPVSTVPADSFYMFDTLRERAWIHDINAEFIGQVILQKKGLKDVAEISKVDSNGMNCCGQVRFLSQKEMPINKVYLENFSEVLQSQYVQMNLDKVPKLSIFPGQVVVVRATNPTGVELVVEDVFCDAAMPLPADPVHLSNTKEPLQVVVVSGPYTPSDTLTYQPLQDFVDYLRKHRPHVAILIGPFVDAEHKQVKDLLLAESFESFFEKQVENLMQSITGLNIQIILVASARDVHHHPVFPTPAYTLKKQYNNLHLVGDPSVLDIDGLKIGVTSVDIIKHLGNQEIVNAANSQDRLGRIAKHVLMQNNFYPLYPPNESVSLDAKLWYDYCHLSFTPHILVLPSDLRTFIKEAFGCVVVNPEHLAKGLVGGCFARLEITAAVKWDPSCVVSQVIKI